MSGFRLLVCLDASRAALAAARLAVAMTADHGGEIRAVSVLEDDETARRLDARTAEGRPTAERLERAARSMLERVAAMGADQRVTVTTELLHGDPLRTVLHAARAWRPDLIIVGRTGRSGPASPMVGSLAMHLVEFADWPVVIVPDVPPP